MALSRILVYACAEVFKGTLESAEELASGPNHKPTAWRISARTATTWPAMTSSELTAWMRDGLRNGSIFPGSVHNYIPSR